MSVPELVRERLRDEAVEAAVSLADDDVLVVTPTRALLYRGEGLISGASVEEYPHDAESVSVSEGRQTSTLRFDHGVDGESEFSVPTSALGDVLPPLCSAVLRANGVLDAGEDVEEVYRLGELTVFVADRRVVKHVGDALWDEDAAVYDYADVTALDVEKGEVSSQLIVEVDGRPQWIKIPSDRAREIRERIETALLAYHDVPSYREFERRQSADDAGRTDETAAENATAPGGETEGGIDELDFGGDVGGVVETEDDATGEEADLAAEVADLREAVERQGELLESQQRTIERLIEELKRR